MTQSINKSEINKFTNISYDWWNPRGKFTALHRINPLRIKFILDITYNHFNITSFDKKPLSGLKILDIGCGGGLTCEPIAKLGGFVKGIDADKQAIHIAKEHSSIENLDIHYENKSIEMLKLNDKNKFDIIFALEIIEHIDDPTNFLEKINPFIRDNGLIFISSINKNLKSLLFAKIAAEYFLGWVPKGTHDWQKFIEPNKLNSQMAELNYDFITSKGIVFDPIKMAWKLSEDLSINYISSYQKLI
ncbi:MAG: bifunctional 2-polyprenyl-6-hydroxyphenol methylase/3-demethylubiquinol 3-O-methyltransferase UbiG [Hyphomicrobiales bacterium]|nr:bifunctional 2-polyprenyl-6-hydroxyphenol methylase/3-demethylubiquinol 3-O-methyltransferase UbiG [Hyphomicrobiales bacterium]|tara:strand:- start:265 stop:1002 length:738 start_codon:yes stop_codon:yes gene_type:complete